MPALAQRRSIGPSCCSVSATIRSTAAGSVTSTSSARPSISRATSSTCSRVRAADRDASAGVRELARNARADPAPTTGDERDLALELVFRHGVRIDA